MRAPFFIFLCPDKEEIPVMDNVPELPQVEVLLIEDNPYDVELAIRAFEKNRFTSKIFVLNDGAEALDYVFCAGRFEGRNINQRPKLIILDLKLPKVGGREFLSRIKNDERTRRIPVVVLTSSQEEADINSCYELGVNSYIVKPLNFEKFVEAVATLGLYWLLMNKTAT
jgi:two-component system, response regulator